MWVWKPQACVLVAICDKIILSLENNLTAEGVSYGPTCMGLPCIPLAFPHGVRHRRHRPPRIPVLLCWIVPCLAMNAHQPVQRLAQEKAPQNFLE
jgi:hypothetical protein